MKRTQKGFTAVEGLLIVLILAVIGFGGYYVWNSQKQADNSLAQADRVSQRTTVNTSKPLPTGWTTYKNKQFDFKFSYPQNWNQNNEKNFINVDPAKNFSEYPGCGGPSCAVTYNISDGRWYDAHGSESKEVNVFATDAKLVAFSIPLRGELNCGSYGIAIPYKGNMINMDIGMCTKPTSSGEFQPHANSLIYEDEATNMEQALSTFAAL